jgi:hypothetical protein
MTTRIRHLGLSRNGERRGGQQAGEHKRPDDSPLSDH